MLKKMKMLEPPPCPLSRHLHLMTPATCLRATILEYRFLPGHTPQRIHQQKCLTAQVENETQKFGTLLSQISTALISVLHNGSHQA